jgi:hypothetical protein
MTRFLNKIKNTISEVQKKVETQTSLLQKKNGSYKVECAIDEEKVDCKDFQEPYIAVPAPIVLPDDPWFGESIKTEKGIKYEEKIAAESKIKEDQRKKEIEETNEVREPDNIHQVMYEMATKNWTTVGETQGGSENFQEGPGGWNSGTGMGQFK